MYLLGIDVGTTNWKVMAYDRHGRPAAAFRCPCLVHGVGDGGAEYEPEEIWLTVAEGIRAVVRQLPVPTAIEGVAVASVGESGVLLDRSDRPVCPALAWFDPRTEPQARKWLRQSDVQELYALTGFAPQHIASVNKLAWLRENEAEAYARAAHWLCLADYVAFRLCGEKVMDYSLASRTGLFDLHRREWADRLLRAAGIDASLMPQLAPSGTAIGGVTAGAARLTGLREGTPVCTGGHDHLCGAFAAGVTEQPGVLDSTGTAEAVLTVLEHPHTSLELCDAGLSVGCHVARDRYYLIGTIATSGAVVEWLKNGVGEGGRLLAASSGEVYRALMDRARSVPPGAGGLLFLPHLRGTAFPVDPRSRAAFVGLASEHTLSHLIRAAVEGVCHELRTLLDCLETLTGRDIGQVTAIGGAVKNPFWLQVKADVTGREILVPEVEEAASLGAALLAGLGVGTYTDEHDAQHSLERRVLTFKPDAGLAGVYDRHHRVYVQLYPLLRGLMAEIAEATNPEHSVREGRRDVAGKLDGDPVTSQGG